jgi:PAS domain S-box-containing protein
MILKVIVTFLVFFAVSVQSMAADNITNVVNLNVSTNKYSLYSYTQILSDPERRLTINDVISAELKNDFRPVSEAGNSFGFSRSAYWVRFTLRFDEPLGDSVLLQLDYPLLDNVSLFIPDGQGGFSEKITGDTLPFTQRDVKYRNFLFILPEHIAESRTYYLRVQTDGSTQIALSLYTATNFIEELDRTNFILGVYYGIMLLLMAVAIASYIKIQDKLFLYYAIYLFSYLIFQLSLNGLSFQYLWPNQAWLTSRATTVSIGLVIICATVFSGSFLQIWNKKYPVVKQLFYLLIIFGAISILLSVFADYAIASYFAAILGLSLPPVILIGAISSVLAGYRPARYFLVAWGVFVLGIFITALLYIGALPQMFITSYAIQLGSTFEILLLGYALMDRVDLLNYEKEKAVTKADLYLRQLKDGLEVQVSERTRQLSESEAYLRALIHALPDLVWWKDPDGVYLGCNPKFERMMGAVQADIVGKTDYDFVDQGIASFSHEKDRAVIEVGAACINEEEVTYADDGHVELLETIKMPMYDSDNELIGILGVGRDITERRHSEQALLNTQKMEAIGHLTGGIAHDFNNILAIIIGNISMLKRQFVDDKKASSRIETIQKSAQRAADLTQQLLSFSRNKADKLVVTDINQVLIEMESLVAHSVTPAIEVKHELANNLWRTEIDPGDFQDVVINLIINARDAMSGRGRLILHTSNCTLAENTCVECPNLEAGEYVQLAVIDDGVGMSSEQQVHIFEPFYTTKEQGKGTGLGLAMVFGFIRRADGGITVDTEVGEGTAIRLYLPRCTGEIPIKKEEKLDVVNEQHRGRETILVVDDEEDLLELAREILQELNYRVLTAINGKQALKVLSVESDISLLLTDVLMPGGINGYELAESAVMRNPNIKILLASGYSSGGATYKNESPYSENVLNKPYNLSELGRRVRQLLDE